MQAHFFRMHVNKKESGVILLMVVFIMSIFLSAGMALSLIFLRSLKSSQNLAESVIAFHAADSGLEHIVYLVRTEGEGVAIPPGNVTCDGDVNGFSVGSACYVLTKKVNAVIFVYAFGKFPSAASRVSRSLGALFEK